MTHTWKFVSCMFVIFFNFDSLFCDDCMSYFQDSNLIRSEMEKIASFIQLNVSEAIERVKEGLSDNLRDAYVEFSPY